MFYKETSFQDSSIGKIPRNWKIKTTRELGEVVTGITPSTLVEEYWDGDYPFVTPTDITDKKYVEKTERKVSAKGLEKGRLVPKDSVLVTCIASIGKMALAFDDCLTNQQINTIICKDEVNPHYVYYAIGFRVSVLESWAGKTTSSIIKKSLFEKFPISIPASLCEQQQIVEVLGVVDSAIELADKVIAKTERLKKGLMQKLLTAGIGHKEFKDTEIGKTPKTWQIARLEDISEDFIGGGTPSTSNPEYWNGDIAWMTSAHISGRLITTGQKYITRKGLENSATHVVPRNNLLVATRVGIGKAAVNKIDIAISQDLTGVVIDKEKASPEFLYWVFISGGNRLRSLAQGSTIKGILREELGKWQIPVPSVNEQTKIDEILSAVDKKLELERSEKTRLERVKHGLMDLLLTGKVRVSMD